MRYTLEVLIGVLVLASIGILSVAVHHFYTVELSFHMRTHAESVHAA